MTILLEFAGGAREVRASRCGEAVDLLAKLAAFDIRTDRRAVLMCRQDMRQHCSRVRPGRGAMFECLERHRPVLTRVCTALLREHDSLASRNVEYDGALRAACSAEQAAFCARVQPGDAAVLACLQAHLPQPAFGPSCRAAVTERISRGLTHTRLDVRLGQACAADLRAKCRGALRLRGDAPLACLVEERAFLAELSAAARNALWLYSRAESRAQAGLALACDADRGRLCADAPGGREVVSCLARSRAALVEPRCAALVELSEAGAAELGPGQHDSLAALHAALSELPGMGASLREVQEGLRSVSPSAYASILASLEANRALASTGVFGGLAIVVALGCAAGWWCLRGIQHRAKGYTAFVSKDG
ncbi:hypothetical protein T492DRAFT_880975 [Pavlovales sp. CCMP2436]|nr:hypothetical protein T492DRAFT_880975 [Pavlovales sp. CCMP2436]